MTRLHLPATVLGTVLATALLAGCGSGTGVDPGAGSASDSPTTTPTAISSIGDHPAYPYADYSYLLEVQCFCPTFGQPVRVTVTDGEVADAVWTKKARDHAKGDEADVEWLRLTINDVLTEAADPRWDEVEMTWPAGQDHPDKVAIDRMTNAIDDEITYLISDVQPVE